MKEPIYLSLPDYLRILLRYLAAELECERACWVNGQQLCHHPIVAMSDDGFEWSFVATGRMGIVIIAADPDLPYRIDEHGCFTKEDAHATQ